MKNVIALFFLLVFSGVAAQEKDSLSVAVYLKAAEERLHTDWAYKARYAEENTKLMSFPGKEKKVIFMGNSITERCQLLTLLFLKINLI